MGDALAYVGAISTLLSFVVWLVMWERIANAVPPAKRPKFLGLPTLKGLVGSVPLAVALVSTFITLVLLWTR